MRTTGTIRVAAVAALMALAACSGSGGGSGGGGGSVANAEVFDENVRSDNGTDGTVGLQ